MLTATSIAQILRAGRLCGEFDRRGQVLAVINEVFMGMWILLYKRWTADRMTIHRFHEVNGLIEQMSSRPSVFLGLYSDFVQAGGSLAGGSGSGSGSGARDSGAAAPVSSFSDIGAQ